MGCVGSYAREDQGQRAGKQSAREDSVGGRRPWKIMLDSKVFTIRIRPQKGLLLIDSIDVSQIVPWVFPLIFFLAVSAR